MGVYNSKTGERIHAPFPQGVIDDVNYGGNLRAFLFRLNNDCCTSIDKSRRFLSDYEPPGKNYRDGYNLYKRMKKYKKDHLLFLHNKNVPATNNEAERLLRKYKRKQAQAVSFRSPSSIDHLCKCMSMLVLMHRKEQTNLFREISEIFA